MRECGITICATRFFIRIIFSTARKSASRRTATLNAGPPGEHAIVMVREGYGVTGLKHAWTLEELGRGHINWHFGRFSTEEMKLISADPMRALSPREAEKESAE
jgi:hypothetical protein